MFRRLPFPPALLTAVLTAACGSSSTDAEGGLVLVEGGDQVALVGEALELPPVVQLLDADGEPVGLHPISFQVTTGGGSVDSPAEVTDPSGFATVGGWTLGPEVGPQELTVTAEGYAPLAIMATAISDRVPTLSHTPYITGIGRPWDLAFLPDGTMLITERGGRIRAVDPGQTTTRIIAEPPADLRAAGQSGMLGIAVDPDFSENRYVYTYLASNRDGQVDNRVRRWTVDEGVTSLTEDRDILTGITYGTNGTHSGGRMRFGPDGHLWITTGDTRSATVPQDLTEMGGKVLRITRDGDPAPGNPDLGGDAHPAIYFVGVRNPQGIGFRPGSGQPFICEHGPNNDDEITALVAGGNGGWNPNDGNGGYNGYSGALMSDPSIPDLVLPTHVEADSQGMSDCTFLVGEQWAAWDRRLIAGFLAGGRAITVRINADGSGTLGDVATTLDEGERLRALVQGPDGALYVALDSPAGIIWRVTAD